MQFSTSPETKKRYLYEGWKNIYDGIAQNGILFKFETYSTKVLEVKPVDDRIQIVREDGKTDTVDFLICSLSYKKMVDQWLQNIAPFAADITNPGNIRYEKVSTQIKAAGRFRATIENVATRVCPAQTTCEEIYVIGTAANDALSVSKTRHADSMTKNSMSIEILAPLTEAFAGML